MTCQYIITVGASLLEVPCFQNDPLLEEFVLNDRRLELDERQQVKNRIATGKKTNLLLECGNDVNRFYQKHPFNRELWNKNKYHLLGAELATLRRIHNVKQNIQNDDALHILASRKNSDGGICGSLLELILKDIFPACSIELHHFEKLDVRREDDLAAGLDDIYHKARNILDKTTPHPGWLVLSGGYKVMVMRLAQLQWHPEFRNRITVAALHEDTEKGILMPPKRASSNNEQFRSTAEGKSENL